MKTKNFPQKKNLRRLIALRKLAEKYRASDAPLWARSAMESLSAAIVSPDVARGIRTKKQRNGKRQS